MEHDDATHDPSAGPPRKGDAAAHDSDDLDEYLTPTRRFVQATLPVVGVIVALAMVLVLGRGLIDAWLFDRAGDDVEAELEQVLEDDTDRALARSVLLVRTIGCDGRSTSGTAFTIVEAGRTILVTNRHVAEGAATIGLRSLTGDPVPRVTSWRLARSADVATLQVDERAPLPDGLVLADRATSGTQVRTVGFPGALPFTSSGEVVEVRADRLTTDVRTDPGASGSPLVDADARVVGQIFARTEDGLGVATTAPALRAALDRLSPRTSGC